MHWQVDKKLWNNGIRMREKINQHNLSSCLATCWWNALPLLQLIQTAWFHLESNDNEKTKVMKCKIHFPFWTGVICSHPKYSSASSRFFDSGITPLRVRMSQCHHWQFCFFEGQTISVSQSTLKHQSREIWHSLSPSSFLFCQPFPQS